MKEEKLKSLYYYFIDKRDRIDNSDDFLAVAGAVSGFNSIFPPHRGTTVVDGPTLESFNNFPVAHAEPFSLDRDVTPMYGQMSQAAHHGAIWFEKHCLYVSPKEQIVSIPIIRSDKCIDKTNKVTWQTCDKSARSGTHYVESSGEVTFELGETKKNIQIGILTSNDASNDLRFTVKLSDTCGVFDPAPLTVVLKEIANLYSDEKSVFNNLDESQPYSVRDIQSILTDCMNQRTFYMGLSYICSTTDTLQCQVALAFELARLCRSRLREDIILNALSNFFAQDDIQP